MNHFISLEQAVQMTTTFRENKDRVLQDQYQGTDLLANAETFDRAAFDKLLSQPGCQQLRIYYGMDAELKVHAIIVGVDADNRDMLQSRTSGLSGGENGETENEPEGLIVELGQRCPPDCGESPLNP